MKSNKVKQNYSKYKKVSTNIKGDLLLDDSFLTNQSKDDSVSTDAVSIHTINQFPFNFSFGQILIYLYLKWEKSTNLFQLKQQVVINNQLVLCTI